MKDIFTPFVNNMNVLSLFDGISCGQVALKRAGINVDNYYASEIDKHAIAVTQKNFPNTIQLGDVRNWKNWDLPKIDLLIGGSPCQGFSFSGKQLNFNDPRSKLFFEYADVLNELEPEYFLLENTRMRKEYQTVISNYLGVEPIEINSSLLSAQTRKRLYWTNIPEVTQPDDKGILLESILESGEVDKDKSYCLDANYFKGTNAKQYLTKHRRQIVWKIPEATKKGYVEVSVGDCIDLTFIKSKTRRGRLMLEKANCLTATSHKMCRVTKDWFRLLTPIECERLQTLPDNYTEGISNSQRYKSLGNGWTVDIVAHIFSYIKQDIENELSESNDFTIKLRILRQGVGRMELSEFEREMYENAISSMKFIQEQINLSELNVLRDDVVLERVKKQMKEYRETERELIEKYSDSPIMNIINAELDERVKQNEL